MKAGSGLAETVIVTSAFLSEAEGPLRLVIYVSSATAPYSDEQLESLLSCSRIRNERDSITGVLLYADGSIMQAFEGPFETVGRLKTRLELDPRHRGIIFLHDKLTGSRVFGDWTMGLVKSSRERLAVNEGLNYLLDPGFDLKHFDHLQVSVLLKTFVQSAQRRIA